MSENPADAPTSQSVDSSMERARYWFEQYRAASGWEARLIRAIRELSEERAAQERDL